MWRCPECNRKFKSTNQWHSCTNIDIGELFIGKPDNLVLAFDTLMHHVKEWQPTEVAAAKKSIVFTSHKAWLIVKPMSKVLDIKFYHDQEIISDKIFKKSLWGKKYAYHIRISDEDEIDESILDLLNKGFSFSME